MDPNETLREIRYHLFNEFDLYTLQLAFAALDEWMCSGGFLPDDWDASYHPGGDNGDCRGIAN